MGAVISRIQNYRERRASSKRAKKVRPLIISSPIRNQELLVDGGMEIDFNYSVPPRMAVSYSPPKPKLEPLNEDCPICLCEVDDEEPLACRHKIHSECLKSQIMHGVAKFEEEHMNFKCASCPLCNSEIQMHPSLQFIINPILELKRQSVAIGIDKMVNDAMAEEVLKNEQDPKAAFLNLPHPEKEELVLRKLLFFQCSDCNRSYFGGTRSCMDDFAAAANNANDNNQNEGDDQIIVKIDEEEAKVEEEKVEEKVKEKVEEKVEEELEKEEDKLEIEIEEVKEERKLRDVERILTDELRSEIDSSYDFTYDRDQDEDDTVNDYISDEEIQDDNKEELKLEINDVNKNNNVEKNENNGDDMKIEEEKKEKKKFICLVCVKKQISGICEHGTDDLIFKCMKCCSIATYYCLGTEFYCNRCHSDLRTLYPCPGAGKCPLGIEHPPNTVGTHGGGPAQPPFAIACKICGPIQRSFQIPNFRVNYN